jgi:hypothetical protein
MYFTTIMTFTNHLSLQVKHLIPATAIKVKNYLSGMRADLSRMIKNWELSGQGDCSLIADDDVDDSTVDDDDQSGSRGQPSPPAKPSFGQLQNRTSAAMDSRANFLKGTATYLLMFWELCDKHQLLASTLQRLDRAAVAGADEVSSVYRITRPSPTDVEANAAVLETSLDKFSNKFTLQTDRQYTVTRHSDILDKMRTYRVSLFNATSAREIKFWEGEISSLEKELELNDAERRRIERVINNL